MRGLGHIPDRPEYVESDLRDRHIGGLIGSTASDIPLSLSYASFVTPRPDQGGSSACVGEAFATSIYGLGKVKGAPIELPSAKAIYDCARLVDAPHKKMLDEGSRPRAAISGLQEYGLVTDDRWPLTDANVNDVPPLDVFANGLGALVSGYYRIGGGEVSTLIRMALAKGFLPVFAMPVDDSYQTYDGSDVWSGMQGPSLGGHYQCCVGYAPGCIIVANSWSSQWGRDGFARIADSWFDSSAVSDVLVVTTIPSEVR